MNNFPAHQSLGLRRARVAAVITATVGLTLLAAACSSGSSGSSNAGGAASSPATGLLAYSSCMRSHGVPNFPDPASNGEIPKQSVISAEGAVSDSQVQTAEGDCQQLIPPGVSLSGQPPQTITAQQQQDYLKVSACMHSHGVANFPEPIFSGGTVAYPSIQHTINTQSTQFTQALQICRKFIPSGLPYSGSTG